MEENNYSAELEKLRAQIDEIDKKIIELLKRRIYIVSAVGELKKNSNEKFFIKSSREADMIKNLLKISGDKISQATIASIWRKIITNANLHEQKIRVAIHNPRNISDFEYLVREYYNSEVPLISFDSTGNVVSELENNLSQIGIFEIPSGENEVEKKRRHQRKLVDFSSE